MWVSKEVHLREYGERVRLSTAVELLKVHNTALQTSLDWMRVRLTQLEMERAQLIQQYTGVKITVPSIEPMPDPKDSGDLLNQTASFDDMGDEAAERDGYGWDSLGRATYKGKVIS